MGKKSIPQAQEASEGNTYHAGKPYSKHREQPTTHTCTTADNHSITFTYHNGKWQAAVKEYGTNGSWERRQLPVVFESGLALEDLVGSNPTEQKQLLHICPDEDNSEHPDYVYVGRSPRQAKPNTQLLSISAARKTAPRKEVGLAQPKQVVKSTQEQPGRQAVLALTNPWQQTGRDRQLPTTPARARSKPLATPSSELPSQQFVQNKFTNAQQTSRKKIHSFKQQNKLQHSQRAAQAKRQRADKMPQGIASQVFLAQGGQHVRFMHHNGQWQASVSERPGGPCKELPVACQRHGDVAKALAALQGKPDKYVQRRIHVLPGQGPHPPMVYIGEQSLKGGMDRAGEPSGDGEQAGASGSGPSQPLAAPQDREASLRTLQARLAQGQDITSSQVVQALHAAQTLEEQQALQQVIRKCIEWFSEKEIEILTAADLQAYSALAHIEATPANRGLLTSYFRSLCNKIEDKVGDNTLIEALEYTLQNIDSDVFDGNPAPLIKLGNTLFAKLDTDSNQFTKDTYPTYRSTLYALHQALVLIQQTSSSRLDPTDQLYTRFKTKIADLKRNAQYYPIRYHALLLEQSLQRLARPQFNLEDFLKGYQNLKEAFTRQGIQAEAWYDWHQAMHYASLLSLEDASKYGDFEQGLQEALKDSKIKQAPKEGRQALRFGIAQQLRLLALEGPTEQVREASTKQLSELAQPEVWGGKPAVMEAMLDGLAAIAVHSQGAEKEQAQEALESLKSFSDGPAVHLRNNWTDLRGAQRKKAAQKALQAWLQEWLKGCPTIKDRLALLKATPAPAVAPASGGLLSTINGLLREEMPVASQPPLAAQAVRQELEKYYQQPDFAQVKSLFEGEKPKHVDSLECQLMLTEPVQNREGPQSDLSTHHERLEWVKNPIALEDLFKRRSTKPDGPEQEIQKVLLVGEPGTGKTTLSKKMASLWAQGKWGEEFNAVYVLPVRALQKDRYDVKGESLVTAIANNCFHPMEEDEEYERFCQQINEELAQPTTLVVLDGLDERYGASEKLLKQAKAGRHKLLLLSRPYGIEQERTMVDIEIEHAGFNDGQMEDYVRDDLSPELGRELLSFIRAYPSIGAIAHVPMNLQILCALWKDNHASVRKQVRNGSLPGLYHRLSEYIWEGYARKGDLKDADCEELFDTLGKIALEALKKGEVLISPGIVQNHVKAPCVKKKLKDSDFLLLQSVGKQYQFPHLTFQEYFAGRALARQLLSGNAADQAELGAFFSEHKYARRYGVMLSFLSGEVSKAHGVAGLRQLLELLEAEPQELVGVQHVLLQMRLLNEWLYVGGEDLEEELASLEKDFPVMESLKEWFFEGLDRVQREDDRKLLNLLTSGLQGSRAVAAHAPALLSPLLDACKEEAFSVRSAATSALGQVREAAPSSQVLEHLLAACKDEDSLVRSAAISALGQEVKVAPELAEKVLEHLLAACKDSSSSVRSAASQALGQEVKVAPELAEKVLEHLIAAGKDSSSSVRSAAISALEQVVKVAPELAEKVLEHLIAAGKDAEQWVRWAASRALGQVVKTTPELAEQVLPSLLAACKDSSSSVRWAASSALGQVVKAAPELAKKVLPSLLAACKDSSSSVRSAASQALGEISLHQLIESYWATKNQELIPLIATKLYQTPLLVRNSPNSEKKCLVLYPTAEKPVEWKRPHQEVEHFVQQIKSAAKRCQHRDD